MAKVSQKDVRKATRKAKKPAQVGKSKFKDDMAYAAENSLKQPKNPFKGY
jgi:hypothetical protein